MCELTVFLMRVCTIDLLDFIVAPLAKLLLGSSALGSVVTVMMCSFFIVLHVYGPLARDIFENRKVFNPVLLGEASMLPLNLEIVVLYDFYEELRAVVQSSWQWVRVISCGNFTADVCRDSDQCLPFLMTASPFKAFLLTSSSNVGFAKKGRFIFFAEPRSALRGSCSVI